MWTTGPEGQSLKSKRQELAMTGAAADCLLAQEGTEATGRGVGSAELVRWYRCVLFGGIDNSWKETVEQCDKLKNSKRIETTNAETIKIYGIVAMLFVELCLNVFHLSDLYFRFLYVPRVQFIYGSTFPVVECTAHDFSTFFRFEVYNLWIRRICCLVVWVF